MARSFDKSPVVVPALVVALLLLVAALWGYVFVNHASSSSGAASDTRAAAATTSEREPSTTSATSAPSRTDGEWSMRDARRALAGEDSRVLVLGDSTGNSHDEWVGLWARAEEKPMAQWNIDSEDGYTGASDETRVWSGAGYEAGADYPADHEQIWPPEGPDLVLLSYGHFHDSGEDATEALDDLRQEIANKAPKAPVVVVLQNPQTDDANADTREAIASWAKESGLPTIDVAKAFEEAETSEELRVDEINPSSAGSQVWADAVGEALAGEG